MHVFSPKSALWHIFAPEMALSCMVWLPRGNFLCLFCFPRVQSGVFLPPRQHIYACFGSREDTFMHDSVPERAIMLILVLKNNTYVHVLAAERTFYTIFGFCGWWLSCMFFITERTICHIQAPMRTLFVNLIVLERALLHVWAPKRMHSCKFLL